MRPLSDRRPKPLLEAGGSPLLAHLIRSLVREGFREIVINLAWLGDQIERYVGDGEAFGAEVRYSREGTALGTGGGILHAASLLGERPFVVVNGDVWTDYPFGRLSHRPGSALAHLVLVDNPPHHPGGDFTLRDGLLGNRLEDRLTFAGIGVYRPALFETPCGSLAEGLFELTPLLRHAAGHGLVSGERYRGEWMDIGTPERLRALDRHLRAE